MAGFVSDLLPTPQSNFGIWVQICGSGKLVRLDLGEEEKPPQQPIHNKVCHAVCCQNEDELEPSDSDDELV